MSVPAMAAHRPPLWTWLVLVVAALSLSGLGCGGSSDEFAGYWRSAEEEWLGPKLIRISHSGDTFTIDAPPMYEGRELTVNGDRLELREQYASGEFAYLRTFRVRPSDGLLWGDYLREPFTGEPPLSTLFERASGTEADLEAELEAERENSRAGEP